MVSDGIRKLSDGNDPCNRSLRAGRVVTTIDADPNKNVVDWAKLPGTPSNLTVIGEVTEETIVEQIEEACRARNFGPNKRRDK